MTDYFHTRLNEADLMNISSVGLAHLGDGVYELLVRTWLCLHGKATGRNLHQSTVALVRATAQAQRVERILPLLTEEEQAVYRRGRNAHVHTVPHAASRSEYAKATALECLFGYLFLRGETERIGALFDAMMEEPDYAT